MVDDRSTIAQGVVVVRKIGVHAVAIEVTDAATGIIGSTGFLGGCEGCQAGIVFQEALALNGLVLCVGDRLARKVAQRFVAVAN